MSDDLDITEKTKQLCIRSNILIRKFAACNRAVKTKLFKSFCTSFYGLPVWSSYKQSTMHRLRVCYNNAFRYLHRLAPWCSASGMFVNYGAPTFGELRRHAIFGFMTRIRNTRNMLLDNLYPPFSGSGHTYYIDMNLNVMHDHYPTVYIL